jgi:hypothetical protein
MMIYVPKKREIIKCRAEQKMGLKGEFRAILRDLNGRELYDTGWERNVITDEGLDLIPAGGHYSHMHIGSDGTAPTTSDVQLGAELGRNYTTDAGGRDQGLAPLYEVWNTRVARFDQGVGTGTIRELGINNSNYVSSPTYPLFSRVTFSTPIVKGADNILDCFYKLTLYPPITDVVQVINIGAEPYNTITRGQRYLNTAYGASPWSSMNFNRSFPTSWSAYDGILGATVEDTPAGNAATYFGSSYWYDAYIPGTYYRDCHTRTGLDNCNLAGGIRTVAMYANGGTHCMGYQFSKVSDGSPIMKDNEKLLDITFRKSWSRYP